MLYFACHGKDLQLIPSDERYPITSTALIDALSHAKDRVSFVHFGCCEMVDPNSRHKTHKDILDASGAKWASGYTKSVDWLKSMFLDLALVSEIFAPQHSISDGRKVRHKKRTEEFVRMYEQLARELGFSALSTVTAGNILFPQRLHH